MAYNFPGSMVLLQTQTASNVASINFTSGITTKYSNYMVVMNNVFPVSSGTFLRLLVSTNGGSSYLTTGYSGGLENVATDTNATWTNVTSTTSWQLTNNQDVSTSSPPASGNLMLFGLTDGSTPVCIAHTYYKSAASNRFYNITASFNSNTNINAIQFIYGSGNISTGKFTLYGIEQ